MALRPPPPDDMYDVAGAPVPPAATPTKKGAIPSDQNVTSNWAPCPPSQVFTLPPLPPDKVIVTLHPPVGATYPPPVLMSDTLWPGPALSITGGGWVVGEGDSAGVGGADEVIEGVNEGLGMLEGVFEGVRDKVGDEVGDEPGEAVGEGVGGMQAVMPTLPLYPLAPAVALTAGKLAVEKALARARFT